MLVGDLLYLFVLLKHDELNHLKYHAKQTVCQPLKYSHAKPETNYCTWDYLQSLKGWPITAHMCCVPVVASPQVFQETPDKANIKKKKLARNSAYNICLVSAL